jgi:hypothetical protein
MAPNDSDITSCRCTKGISLLLLKPLAGLPILQHNKIIGRFSPGHAEMVKIAQRKLKP